MHLFKIEGFFFSSNLYFISVKNNDGEQMTFCPVFLVTFFFKHNVVF